MRALAFAMLVIAAPTGCSKPAPAPSAENGSAEAEAGMPAKGVDRSHRGQVPPSVLFTDPKGIEVNFHGFLGRPVLVNLWATWCAPCVKELPTLDRLARGHQDGSLDVLAISQDMGPQTSVEAFLKKLDLKDVAPFFDPNMRLSGALGAQVLPTTILYDADGREVWRYVGDLDWTSPEAAKLLAEAGAAKTG